MICEKCGKDRPNCGRFQTSERTWERLCGGCKVRITIARPGFREQLQKDAQAFAAALMLDTKGGKA